MGSEAINLDSMIGCNERVSRECNFAQTHSGKVKQFVRFLCTKICICLIIFGIISIVLVCVAFLINYENDAGVMLTVDVSKEDLSAEQNVWFRKGLNDLEIALSNPVNTKRAQHVILFVADGFNPETMNAARVQGLGNNGEFRWDNFPHIGLLRWHRNSSAGTSIFGGVRAQRGTSGVDSSVDPNECIDALDDTKHVNSIISWAQSSAFGTGLVTNGDIRDGTVASLYAHVANDSWKCPGTRADNLTCLDTQTQLMEHYPGKDISIVVSWNVSDNFCIPNSAKSFWNNNYRFIDDDESEVLKAAPGRKHLRVLLPEYLRAEVPMHTIVSQSIQILKDVYDRFLLAVICKPVSKNTVDGVLELDQAVKLTMDTLGDSLDETLIIVVSSPFSNKDTTTNEKESIDTAIYARGPMAHLFHRVHDPTYVAHAIAYAARLGRFRDSIMASSILQWFS